MAPTAQSSEPPRATVAAGLPMIGWFLIHLADALYWQLIGRWKK